MDNPTPLQIQLARSSAGLTQTKAAELIHCKLRTWQDWEAGKNKMHLAMWELFNLKVKEAA